MKENKNNKKDRENPFKLLFCNIQLIKIELELNSKVIKI